jgi:glycerate 2-kinase
MIPQTLLVATSAFDERLSAQRVASAIARGLRDAGREADLCPLDGEAAGPHEKAIPPTQPGANRALLDELDFDARMRAARAVILAAPRLHEDTLAGSLAFEIATRARQAGVPAYAITGENHLDAFDARILDLQEILQARTRRALQGAARKLAGLV